MSEESGSVRVPEGRGQRRPQSVAQQEDVETYPKESREKAAEVPRAGGRRPSEIAEEFGISSDSVVH